MGTIQAERREDSSMYRDSKLTQGLGGELGGWGWQPDHPLRPPGARTLFPCAT